MAKDNAKDAPKARLLLGFDRTKAKISRDKDNPYREGCKLWAGYEKLKNGMTLQAAIDAGVSVGRLRWYAKGGTIRVAA